MNYFSHLGGNQGHIMEHEGTIADYSMLNDSTYNELIHCICYVRVEVLPLTLSNQLVHMVVHVKSETVSLSLRELLSA
jgi:hypothetical protein